MRTRYGRPATYTAYKCLLTSSPGRYLGCSEALLLSCLRGWCRSRRGSRRGTELLVNVGGYLLGIQQLQVASSSDPSVYYSLPACTVFFKADGQPSYRPRTNTTSTCMSGIEPARNASRTPLPSRITLTSTPPPPLPKVLALPLQHSAPRGAEILMGHRGTATSTSPAWISCVCMRRSRAYSSSAGRSRSSTPYFLRMRCSLNGASRVQAGALSCELWLHMREGKYALMWRCSLCRGARSKGMSAKDLN